MSYRNFSSLKVSFLFILIILNSQSCSNNESSFQDVHIAFMVGGGEDHFFARRIYQGAREAQLNLGCKVDYYWSDWDIDQMVLHFMEAIESQPDAICIMGHPGLELLEPLVSQAERRGIVVTSQNVYIPELEKQLQHRGFGYVGQDLYLAGRRLVKAAVSRYPIDSDDIIWVIGIAEMANRGRRTMGILDELDEKNLPYEYFEAYKYVTDNEGYNSFLMEQLQHESLPDYLFIDFYTSNLVDIMVESPLQPDEVASFAFDLSDQFIRGIRLGYIDLIQDQQPYVQGYLPIVQACLSVTYRIGGLHIETDSSIIDKNSLDGIEDLVHREYR